MLVQVNEIGPDGVNTVIWDTNKIRALGVIENDDCVDIDYTWFADYLESGNDILCDKELQELLPDNECCCHDFSYSYGGIDEDPEPSKNFDKTFTLYLD